MKKNIKKEQNKQKLSKNWKLYASALGALVIGAGTGLGIYYGINANHSEVTKTDLSTLGLETTILSKKNMTQEVAFNDFLNANKNFTDLKNNIKIETFTAATYETNGSLTIKAKANSKYIGTITVTITKLAQTNLKQMITVKTISGEGIITGNQVLQAVANTIQWSNLIDFAEVETFTAPTYISNGSLTIKAKANTAFTGSVTVTITKLRQTNLSMLEFKTALTIPVANKQAAFDLFIKLNSTITDLKNNIEIETFIAPTYISNGSLTIKGKANSKYIGTITVTIPKLAQTDLNTLGLNTTISETWITTENEAFNVFLNANKSWSNLNDFVEYSAFITPTYISNGSLTINAKANTAFTGSVTVNIAKLAQTNLSTLELNTTIAAELNASQDQVFQAFLNKNKNILGDNLTLEQVELTNYQSASWLTNGKLTITVKAGINSKYIGTIVIVTQYILNDKNISNLINYLSYNSLLNFSVRTGTPQDSNGSNILSTLIAIKFRELMTGIYQYASNIERIELYTYNQGPTQSDLNSWYYVWTTPKDFFIEIAIIYKDQSQEIIHIDNIKATITISTRG